MSETAHPSSNELVLRTLTDQINELTVEVTILRESIVTGAELDLQSRLDRQRLLDQTLAEVRTWMRALVGVNLLLAMLVLWLVLRAAG
ncbi:MAG TPA: hypothetical protein VFO07_19065 [Roseiflexaceae bacterium]|nr:hypothetical protein [Roseiflexaceae bacterium]